MKKGFVVFVMMIVSIVFGFSAPFSYIRNGSFAYYYDGRGGNQDEYLRGFMICNMEKDTSLVLMHVINLTSNEKYRLAVVFGEDEKKELKILQVNGLNNLPEERQLEIRQSIPDILNFDSMYRLNEKKIGLDSTIEDKWEKYSLYYHFSSVFPMFKFDYISFNSPKDDICFVAERYGLITDINPETIEQQFYNVPAKLFQETKRESKDQIPEAQEKIVTINGARITLDENWKENDVDILGQVNTGMWLAVESPRDAQIMIENVPDFIPFKTTKDKYDFITTVLSSIPNIIPYSVQVREEKKDIIVSYTNYDENNLTTVNIMRFTKNKIVNFSAFNGIFRANHKYFYKILDGIEIKK